MLILRSLMFVPGNQERRIERARSVPADALILDIEDSVPPAEKETARRMIAATMGGLATSGRDIFVRVNSLQTPHITADIEAAVTKGLRGILLPKTESADDVHRAEALLADAERKAGIEVGSVGIIALIESPIGVINAYQIASASPRIIGMTLGAEDYALEIGVNRTKEGTEIRYPLMVLAVACQAANVLPLDCVFTDVRDGDGLVKETRMARQLGYKGKMLIHPDQVVPVNQVFTPAEEEINHARRVVEIYEGAVAQGLASVALDGRMVDAPVAERARRLLSLAESMANKGQ